MNRLNVLIANADDYQNAVGVADLVAKPSTKFFNQVK